MKIINCEEIRDKMLDEAENEIYKLKGKQPCLAVILVGDNPASITYVSNKMKICDKVGIKSDVFHLSEYSTVGEVQKYIEFCNNSSKCNGILLQLPLPDHLKEYEQYLIDCIDPLKDVDGLTTINQGKLWTGQDCIAPCTPTGILRLLDEDLSGKVVAIAGRSKLVGNPLIKLLQDRNATVISCHSRTCDEDKLGVLQNCDIFISAIGVPKYWHATPSDVDYERCKTIIDVGINRDENGKLCGDVDIETFKEIDVSITPVPKGVGVLTTAQLMLNTIKCYKMQKKSKKF